MISLIVIFIIFYFFIKQHVGISGFTVSTTTSTKTLPLYLLWQIYLSHHPVIELVPLPLSLNVRVVMASLCRPWVNQNAAQLITVRLLLLFSLFLIHYCLVILYFNLYFHLPGLLLFFDKLVQWEILQIQVHRKL